MSNVSVTESTGVIPSLPPRPISVIPSPLPASGLGAYLADLASHKANAVRARERQIQELELFGAPLSLVQASRRALRDEVRHARLTAQLASRHGGMVFPTSMS